MQKKILVIDDELVILEAFEALLESEGYAVQTSPNPEPLESLKKDNLPDLILLDVLLSGTDGRDVCKMIKKNPLTKNIPVIMISAHPTASQTVKKYGADDFLSKPFEMDDLFSKIQQYTS